MIAPTEGSIVLNLSGEVEGRLITNKQGVMTVETDVVEESSSGGGTLIVDIIVDTESGEPVPTGINKTFNEISTALESGSFVVFRMAMESEEDGTQAYVAYFSLLARVEATVSGSEAEYVVVTDSQLAFIATDPDENMTYETQQNDSGSSPSL